MQKLRIAFLAALLASTATFAGSIEVLNEANEPIRQSAPSISLQGVFDFSAMTRWQKKLKNKNLSANNKSVAFNSSANITAKLQASTDQMTYGAKVILLTTANPKKTPGYNGSHLFIEADNFGKIELGSPFDVSTNMQIWTDSLGVTDGSSWYSILDTNPNDAYGFDINPGILYLSDFTSKNLNAVNRETSRKINYYTPVMNGFQFGVSYIPDTTNGGADKKDESNSYADREIRWIDGNGNTKKYSVRYGAKNAFALGASYEAEIAEATSLKIAVTGEFGKALQEAFIKESKQGNPSYQIDPAAAPSATATTYEAALAGDSRIKDLRSYSIGAKLVRGNLSYLVSYGNLGKSFTSKAVDGNNRSTDFYTAGIAYKQGRYGVSLIYTGGNNKKNKFNSIALGGQYTIAPGLIIYSEVACASGKGYGKVPNAATGTFDTTREKFSGTSSLLGFKSKL